MRRLPYLGVLLMPALLQAQRHCDVVRVPDPLPLAMQLVDSAALASTLPDRVLPATTFSLWYDERGRLTHALSLADSAVVRGEATPDAGTVVRAVVSKLIADAAFPQDSGKAMMLRLTVARDSTKATSLHVEQSVICGPSRKRMPSIPYARQTATREDIDELDHLRPATLTFIVETSGRPAELLVTESSGSRLVDTRFIEMVQSTTYEPGTVDGFPKQMTIRLQMLVPWRRP